MLEVPDVYEYPVSHPYTHINTQVKPSTEMSHRMLTWMQHDVLS